MRRDRQLQLPMTDIPPPDSRKVVLLKQFKTVASHRGEGHLDLGDECAECHEGIWQGYLIDVFVAGKPGRRMILCGECYRRMKLEGGEARGG